MNAPLSGVPRSDGEVAEATDEPADTGASDWPRPQHSDTVASGGGDASLGWGSPSPNGAHAGTGSLGSFTAWSAEDADDGHND